MIDYFQQLLYSDKIFQNPVLGKVSCGAFYQTLVQCRNNNLRTKGQNPCFELKQVTDRCFRAKDGEQVNEFINKQFQQSLMLLKFLKERKSSIPQKMHRNSWSVFTNKTNLQKYETTIAQNQRK